MAHAPAKHKAQHLEPQEFSQLHAGGKFLEAVRFLPKILSVNTLGLDNQK